MPVIYIKNALFTEIIQLGEEPKKFVNDAVEEKLAAKKK